MPTRQNHNVLTISNADFDRQAAQVCFAGAVRLSTQEIASFLKWLREGPVSDHVIISFGDGTTSLGATTGDRVAFGAVEKDVARANALALVTQAMTLTSERGQSVAESTRKVGEHDVR